MKKLFFLIFCMVLSIGARADFSGSGSGTATDPYIIVNPNQLNELRNFLNDANVYFKLEDDIDLSKWISVNNPTQGWQPVGVSASPFKGHLDGNGKTIKNFMINRTTDYVGMFGYMSGAEVKDLIIEGTVKGNDYTGGFAGHCENNSTISNVHFIGNVTGGSNTGGFIGMNKLNSLNGVSVKGNVTGNNIVGGIIGYSEYSNCVEMTYEGDIVGTDDTGGICGKNYSGQGIISYFTSCFVNGTIHANDNVGGIVGNTAGYATFNMTHCGAFIDISANSRVGGLCGVIEGDVYSFSYSSYIKNCYAIGNITCTGSYVGGLIGHTRGQRACNIGRSWYYYNEYITNSYFNGSVLGHDNVGGLIGWTYGTQMGKNYCAATVNGNSNVGGLVGHVDDSSAKIKSCVALNPSVNAIVDNVGRIYGSVKGDINIGAIIGTSDENRALLTTKVSANGIALQVEDDMQNGTSYGEETFKLRATYQGLGWDFTNDWRNQETECYPYNPMQAAPPIILSGAVAGSTTIHGKSYNGGTVYVTVGDKTYSTTCSGNLWDVTTDSQQAGDLIRVYAIVDDLSQSYYKTQYVEYKGSGTAEDPYQIYTADDLARLNGNYYYKLMNDIDLSNYISKNSPTEGWQPIGRNGAVMAHFDGGNHTISGLWCNSTKDYTGLFANASSNTICNLTVKVAKDKNIVGKNYTGILLGNNTNGTIENCTVIGEVEGENYTGGLVGRANGCSINSSHVAGIVFGTVNVGGMVGEATNGSISKSNADVEVSSSTAEALTGGLVGNNSAIITECKSTGTISSTGTGANAGGLVGNTTSNITNSYSTADVNMASDGVYMGGLVGISYATIEKCYAAGNLDGAKWAGGLVGENIGVNAFVKNSFAVNHIVNVKDPQGYAERVIGGYKDGASTPEKTNYAYDEMQVSVNNVPMVVYDDIINGIAKTDTELKTAATYAVLGWNMNEIWGIIELSSYPYLINVNVVTPTDPDDTSGEEDTNEPNDDPTPSDPSDPSDIEASTDLSVYPNVLYFNDVENKVGDFNLELNMKCAEENITAFQCDVYLPEGVEWKHTVDKRGKVVYDQPTFNEDRTDESYHSISPIALNADGSYRMIVYSMANEIILETDGAILTLPLSISEEMEAGDYNLIIKGIVVTDVNKQQTLVDKVVSRLTIPSYTLGDVNGDDMINVTDVVSVIAYILGDHSSDFIFPAGDINEDGVINVTDVVSIIDIILNSHAGSAAAAKLMAVRKTLASGDTSNLEIIPFAIAEGTSSSTVKLNLNNPGDEFTAFQCDIQLPEGIDWENTVDKRGNVKYTTPVFDSEADRTDASYHTVSVQKTDGIFRVIVYSMANETILDEEGAVLDIPFVYADDIASGVYDVSIKNVVLTRVNKTDVKPADYTFSVLVGSPAESAIALNGNFTDEAINEYNTVLAANTTVAAIDLSNAVDVSSNTAFTTGNKNLVLYVAEDADVKNTNNVVVGGECANLVLTDGYNFAAPVEFTAASASYEREMTTTWGTIVLPFDVTSNENVVYYLPTEVDGGTLLLTRQEVLPANTPALVENVSGSGIAASATNVDVSDDLQPSVNNSITMYGSYVNGVRVDNPSAYYIYNDKFWLCNEYFYANAFRGYFALAGTAPKTLSVIVGDGVTTGVDGVNTNNVEGYYDLSGKRFGSLQKGVNIVKTKTGESYKVIVE